MEMMGMMGMTALLPLLGFALWIPMIAYIVARWRTYREGLPGDPHLGLKTAMKFFQLVSFQVALIGVFFLLFAIFQKGEGGRGDTVRMAFGLILPAGLVYAAHFVGLTRTNNAEFPLVGRIFDGANLIQTGLLGFLALTAAFFLLLQKGDSGNVGRAAWSAVFTYVPAWGALGFQFLQKSGFGNPPGAAGFARGPTAGGVPVPPPAVPVPPPAVPPPR